jgi:hypothetical protein
MFADIMYYARQYREGAFGRCMDGGSIGDDGYRMVYDAMVHDAMTLGSAFGVDSARLYGIFVNAARRGADAADRTSRGIYPSWEKAPTKPTGSYGAQDEELLLSLV